MLFENPTLEFRYLMNMRNGLFCFLLLSVSVVHGQKYLVQLADFQSSECVIMYHVKPGFVRNETIGDTTYIDLYCTNNCSGYHNPSINLSGDSVQITVPYGRREIRYLLRNGEYLDEDDVDLHPKDSVLTEEKIVRATCDCCFTFKLKILGLDPKKKYWYVYNGQFIDPNYKTKIVLEE